MKNAFNVIPAKSMFESIVRGMSVAIIMWSMLYQQQQQKAMAKKSDALPIGIVYEFNQSIHSNLVHSIGK